MKTNGEKCTRKKIEHYSVVCTEQFFNGIDGDEVNNPGYKRVFIAFNNNVNNSNALHTHTQRVHIQCKLLSKIMTFQTAATK